MDNDQDAAAEDSTRVLFNEQGIFISPDIAPAVLFLMEIEKEIESLLGFNEKLESIKASYLEIIDFVSFLSGKLRENDIDFEYRFKEDPGSIGEKLAFNLPLRSQMIVLFASLEVLFTLNSAYEEEITNEEELRKFTMEKENTKKFLNSYLLNDENEYYANSKARLNRIDSGKLRNLRNSLTHFFSIGHGGLSIAPDLLKDRSRKFENILRSRKKGNVMFLSEKDLHELIKKANLLRFKRWSLDSQNDPISFKRKMRCVIELVRREGAIIVPNSKLQF